MAIKVYSTPTCPYCLRLKKYLSDEGVSFDNIDVASDEPGLREMVNVSGQMGVPVVVIDGEVIVGFDQAKIAQKLGI
ncbi:MAG: glutaredoxin domain-containing protein [Candidatus Omnitrophota bacterium]